MNKDLRFDAFVWVMIILAASAIAFGLLRRDAARSFGAVAFGSLPAFRIPTVGKGFVDDHMSKGHVWAIHTASSSEGLMRMADRLSEISKRTASGKRQMFVLSVSDSISSGLSPMFTYHFIALANPQEMTSIFGNLGVFTDDSVLLVDQNGVIRGKYDFSDIQGFKNFQRDMMRIL